MMIDLEEIRLIPKIELHAHLNGSVRVSYLADMTSAENLPALPPHDAHPQDYFDFMGKIQTVVDRPERLEIALTKILEDFERDGVAYLELRSSPRLTDHMSKADYIETIISTIKKYPGAVTTRYIVSIDQSRTLTEMMENADLAIKYNNASPYVCGVDLCGNFYKANLNNTLQVLTVCKKAGLKITCHIAEDPVVMNQTDDILNTIKPDRLGHATFTSPDSKQGELVQDSKMLIECCITSNILCKSVKKYEDHHFMKWLKLGHPVLLCTDDVGAFDTSLSEEYKIAIETFDLSVADLAQMNLDAIECIFDDDLKDQLRKLFQ